MFSTCLWKTSKLITHHKMTDNYLLDATGSHIQSRVYARRRVLLTRILFPFWGGGGDGWQTILATTIYYSVMVVQRFAHFHHYVFEMEMKLFAGVPKYSHRVSTLLLFLWLRAKLLRIVSPWKKKFLCQSYIYISNPEVSCKGIVIFCFSFDSSLMIG